LTCAPLDLPELSQILRFLILDVQEVREQWVQLENKAIKAGKKKKKGIEGRERGFESKYRGDETCSSNWAGHLWENSIRRQRTQRQRIWGNKEAN
jgi:hypothetical protein